MDIELTVVTEHQPDPLLQQRCYDTASSDEIINLLGASDVTYALNGAGKTELTYHLDVMDHDVLQLVERFVEAYLRLMVYPALIRVTTKATVID